MKRGSLSDSPLAAFGGRISAAPEKQALRGSRSASQRLNDFVCDKEVEPLKRARADPRYSAVALEC